MKLVVYVVCKLSMPTLGISHIVGQSAIIIVFRLSIDSFGNHGIRVFRMRGPRSLQVPVVKEH